MAYGDSLMEWVDGNLGSKITMKYPAIYLMEPGARGETLSIAFANTGQHQDAGAKMVHCAPNTSSRVISKSISKGGGRSSYRGLAKVVKGQLFYLMSRGMSEAEASAMIVTGFIEPLVKELPMEYAVEMNRLIELQMEGSVG